MRVVNLTRRIDIHSAKINDSVAFPWSHNGIYRIIEMLVGLMHHPLQPNRLFDYSIIKE